MPNYIQDYFVARNAQLQLAKQQAQQVVPPKPQPAIAKNGIQEAWVKSKGTPLKITAAEWTAANRIMHELIQQKQKFPLKISKSDYQKNYPALNHSFVIIDTPQGPQCGFLSKSKDNQEGIVGHGKMGMVKAIQWQDGTQDILKIQPASDKNSLAALSELDNYLGQFTRERAQATPWIQSKDKVKEIKDKQYILLKKAPGETLKDVLKQKKVASLSNHEKLNIAIASAKAILDLHAKKIIHTDIHPGNMMLDENNQATLIDLDAIQKLPKDKKSIILGKPIGSRSYMAPEVGVWRADGTPEGKWVQREGKISLESDVYAFARMLEKDLGFNTIPEMQTYLQKMQATDPAQRPTIKKVMQEMVRIQSAYANQAAKNTSALTISIGQALLQLIAHYEKIAPAYTEELKRLYMVGFVTLEDKKLLEKIKQDPLLREYEVSDNFHTVADDASRRYFETHLSFETMKEAIRDYPLAMIQGHYDSIKSCFKDLGGDLDLQKFKKNNQRVIRRNYKKEIQERAKNNVDPNDLIYGISKEEQQSLDNLLSGKMPNPGSKEYQDPMYMEYVDMLNRIKESPYLSAEDKQKALLVVKSTRLSMILGNKMEKYKAKGTYTGDLMPGDYIFKTDIYQKERGRVPQSRSTPVTGSHHMGLIHPDMPLDKNDEAYATRPFPYQKPSENSTFDENAGWIKSAMDKKVHTFSNSISGTLLAQLRMMIKLYKEGKLVFTSKEDFVKHFRSMISTMTYITGGHSLVEFCAPLQLKEVMEEFKAIPGFNEITLEELFYKNNQPAYEKALEKTQKYNANYVQAAKKDKAENLPAIALINESQILNQFKLQKSTGNTIPTDYTHLNPNHIRQSVGLAALMESATGKAPGELVTYKPGRALLHEVAAYVTAFVKTENEAHRNTMIQEITTALNTTDLAKILEDKYVDIKKTVEKNKNDKMYQEALQAARKITLPSAYCKDIDSAEKLAVEIVTAQKMRAEQDKILQSMVAKHIKSNPQYMAKSSAKNGTPVVMFASGGQGAGKGSSIASMLKNAQTSGIDPRDFVYLNNDSYKPLLKTSGMNPKVFSQLTHVEAKCIRDKAHAYATQNKMHVLLDQVSPSVSAIQYAKKHNGVIKGVFVSTQVEEAIQRSFTRGQETGRYEDTQSILSCHQQTVNKAKDFIIKSLNEKAHLDFFDNSSTDRALFMTVDGMHKNILIHNKELLKDFIKKQCININAKKYEEIYDIQKISDKQLDKLTADWIDALHKAGYQIQDKQPRNAPRALK